MTVENFSDIIISNDISFLKGENILKMTKKCRILTVVVCAICFMFAMQSSAFAYNDINDFYIDCDNDGYSDMKLNLYTDYYSKTATISEIESSEDKVVIPAVVDLKHYDDDYEYLDEYTSDVPYTITSIDWSGCSAEDEIYNSIVIPSTVSYISSESVGYRFKEVYNVDEDYEDSYDDLYGDDDYDDDYEYDDWNDDDYWYDDEPYYTKVKIDGFVIYCTEDSAADEYAKSNGFETVYMKDLSMAQITVNTDSIYYNYECQKPDITVTFDGQILVADVDYQVFYYNNLNIGTAKIVLSGKGDYNGTIISEFEIKRIPAEMVEVSAIEPQYYCGWEIEPYFYVTYNGESIYWYDYSYDITNNINPGKGKIVISFDSDMFEGTKTVYFNIIIEPMEYLNVTALSDSEVYLEWNYVPCGKYYIYRYDESTGKYEYLTKTANTYYIDKGLKEITKYKYAVKAVKSSKSNTALKEAVRTMLKTPELTLTTKNKAAALKWTKNSKADGYQIYRSSNWADEKKVKTIRDNKTTKWTNTKLNNDYDYFFCIRAYKKIGGKTYYSQMSPTQYSGSSSARVNGANLKSHTSFKVYNTQGTKTTFMYNINLNETDIKLLDKFKKKYFKEGMTREEQLQVTLDWINKNVKYALGDDWAKISGKTWVQAIFKYKMGQCAQYNGAMAAMMAYLGYDVQVVMGYRGTWKTNYWQHFWTEVKIQGSTYIVETGNYGRSGSWSYLIRRYSEAPGYIKNQKNL